MVDKEARKEILVQLAKLGGQQLQEEQIKRQGTEFIIPEKLSLSAAIKELIRFQEAQETPVKLEHRYNYRYLDGLVAVKRVLKKLTGFTSYSLPIQTMFGSFTPPSINIQTGPDSWESCPQGEFPLEIFGATVRPGSYNDDEKGTLFWISVEAPRKYEAAVKGFFQLVQTELETNSIYRGRAITAEEVPSFLDLSAVNPDHVVYSEEVLTQLDANIWSLVEHTDAMRENNLPLKRAVLLEGPYGTGKTLAAYLTAQRAEENYWTFLFVRPGKDNLPEAMRTAQLYQPAVVFFEDIDVGQEEGTNVSQLLDVFDGIQAKGTEIVAVLTTNHAEKIHKGLVRPGRLDAVIHIGELDSQGVGRMIRSLVDNEWLPDDLDEEAIHASMEGFMPAFVKEAVDRAVRYRIARNDGQPGALTNQDFIDAANGLKPQLELMNDALEEWTTPPLEQALGKVVNDSLARRLGNFEILPIKNGRGDLGWTANVQEREESST